MIRICLFSLLAFIYCSCRPPAAYSRIERNADEMALRHLKTTDWPKSYREQDTALLDRILADEFQMIDEFGNVSTKALQLEYIKTHKPAYDSFWFEIKRLDIFENRTAVVSGTGHIIGKNEKGTYRENYQSSNILIKRNGFWKAVASHVSGSKINY